MSKIKITCEAKEYLDFSEMAEFQGELKQRMRILKKLKILSKSTGSHFLFLFGKTAIRTLSWTVTEGMVLSSVCNPKAMRLGSYL